MNNRQLPPNLQLFFQCFVKAVESKNRGELEMLISDDYQTSTLINRDKETLISFITEKSPGIPLLTPLLTFNVDATFYRVDYNEERDTYTVIMKPEYKYTFFGITLMQGLFGEAKLVSVILRSHPSTTLYQITRMDEVEVN